jgi:hypothetical protein
MLWHEISDVHRTEAPRIISGAPAWPKGETMRKYANLAAVCLTSMAAVSPIAACTGSGGSSPDTAPAGLASTVREMQKAAVSARSVHVTGQVANGGAPMEVDLSLTSSGDMSGTVTNGGVVITVLATGGKFYILASKSFMRMEGIPQSRCAAICGKYIAEPAEAKQGFAELEMPTLIHGVMSSVPVDAGAVASVTTFHGESVLRIVGRGTIVDVANSGTPYPLGVNSQGGKTNAEFSQWNSATIPDAPASNRVVQLTSLTLR